MAGKEDHQNIVGTRQKRLFRIPLTRKMPVHEGQLFTYSDGFVKNEVLALENGFQVTTEHVLHGFKIDPESAPNIPLRSKDVVRRDFDPEPIPPNLQQDPLVTTQTDLSLRRRFPGLVHLYRSGK